MHHFAHGYFACLKVQCNHFKKSEYVKPPTYSFMFLFAYRRYCDAAKVQADGQKKGLK
jgi:hypothetical protein